MPIVFWDVHPASVQSSLAGISLASCLLWPGCWFATFPGEAHLSILGGRLEWPQWSGYMVVAKTLHLQEPCWFMLGPFIGHRHLQRFRFCFGCWCGIVLATLLATVYVRFDFEVLIS